MADKPNITNKATEIAGSLVTSGFGAIDINALIQIITEVIKLFQNCKLTPNQAELRAANPRFLDKLQLRRIIRRNSAGDEEALEAALLDAGNDLTAGDVKKMYSELPTE